jgi:hypothetical protein
MCFTTSYTVHLHIMEESLSRYQWPRIVKIWLIIVGITVLGCTYMTTSLKGANRGMVQAWMAHFVTPLKCMYGKYDWQVMSQKPYKKHKSPSKHDHHGGEAARPSSGVDLMNPCRLRGGRPCACLFQCRRWSNLIDSINQSRNLFISIDLLLYWNRARPPATMVAETASIAVSGGQ